MEFVIFVAFVGIQYAAKAMPTWLQHLEETSRCRVLAAKLSGNHFIVWLVHPAVLHGLHDYAIHFIVYSGYVLRTH